MVDPYAPRSQKPPHRPLWRRWAGFLIGSASGLSLWLIIALVTQSPGLGLVFGFLPGPAIGIWLDLTRRA